MAWLRSIVRAVEFGGIFCATVSAGIGQTNSVTRLTQPEPSRPESWAIQLNRPHLSNFYQVTTNLYRGAQPTASGMVELKKMRIKTVVNLRSFHSDDDPVAGTEMKQGRLHMKPWHAEEDDVVRFLKLATDTNNLPVFVHCQRGADRTGMVCAMFRIVVCGWTKGEAIREMKEGGFGFNPAWKNIVRFIEREDIEKIRREVGLSPDKMSASVDSNKKEGDVSATLSE